MSEVYKEQILLAAKHVEVERFRILCFMYKHFRNKEIVV